MYYIICPRCLLLLEWVRKPETERMNIACGWLVKVVAIFVNGAAHVPRWSNRLIPKTFVNLPSYFWYAKIILRCQNMFYNSGEVISDQFHHITLDSKSGKFWKKSAKTRSFGNFFHCEGGGSPIPKSICQNSYQKVNIFVKTKNAPNDLKGKINHTFFFGNRGSQKGGRGGPTLGKNSQKIPFFEGGASLTSANCNCSVA